MPANARSAGRWMLALLLLGLLVFTPMKQADRQAAQALDDAFQRALITFGVARGLNALISVVQGTELAIEPAGVGVVLTPGQVLDPVNDLIERFSWVMLLSSTALGLQKVLLAMSGWQPLQITLMLALALGAILIVRPAWLARPWRRVMFRAIALLMLLRFAIPLVALANETLYAGFLELQYRQSFDALDHTKQSFESERKQQLAEAGEGRSETGAGSLLERLKGWAGAKRSQMNLAQRVELYKQRLAQISEHVIHLAVVFLLQTVLFPLLLLWVLWQTLRQILMAVRLASEAGPEANHEADLNAP